MKNRRKLFALISLLVLCVAIFAFGGFFGKYVKEFVITRVLDVKYGSDAIHLLPGQVINAMMAAEPDHGYTVAEVRESITSNADAHLYVGNHPNIHQVSFGATYAGLKSAQTLPNTCNYVVTSYIAEGETETRYQLTDISGLWAYTTEGGQSRELTESERLTRVAELTNSSFAQAAIAKRDELKEESLSAEERVDSFIAWAAQNGYGTADAAKIFNIICGRSTDMNERNIAVQTYLEAIGAVRANEASDSVPCYMFYDSAERHIHLACATAFTTFHFNSEKRTEATHEDNPDIDESQSWHWHVDNNFFAGLTNMTDIELLSSSQIDTSDTTSFVHFFKNCNHLNDADVQNLISRLQVSSANDITGMFQGLRLVTTIDMSSFNLSLKPLDLSWLFEGDASLKTVIFPSGSNAVSALSGEGLRATFQGCSSIEFIDLSLVPMNNYQGEMDRNSNTYYTINEMEGNHEDIPYRYMVDLDKCFNNCSSLRTIVVADDFAYAIADPSRGYSVFNNCTNLVGGNGSSYAQYGETYIDFAVIDGSTLDGVYTEKNGYFTTKSTDAMLKIYNDGTETPSFVINCDIGDIVTLGSQYYPDDPDFVGWAFEPYAAHETISKASNVQVQDATVEIEGKTTSIYAVRHPHHVLKTTAQMINDFQKYDIHSKHIVFCTQEELPALAVRFGDVSEDRGHVGMYALDDTIYIAVENGGNEIWFNQQSVNGNIGFFTNRTELETVSCTDSVTLKTEANANLNYFFQGCTNLVDVNSFLTHFDMSNIGQAYAMFKNCTSLTEIDLSNSNIDSLSLTGEMFNGCESLETIYVNRSFENSNTYSNPYGVFSMFYGCNNLVGEKGTAAASLREWSAYSARIDGESGIPGYYTAKRNPVKITFEVGSDAVAGAITEQNGKAGLPMEISDLAEPSTPPSGYAFIGWTDDIEDCGEDGTVNHSYDAGQSVTLESDLTLYAVYTPAYTITYDVGEDAIPGTVTYSWCHADEDITIPAEAEPTKEGYFFLGWSDEPDGDVDYETGYIFENVNADKTIYAVYIEECTVSYDAGDGTPGPITSQSIGKGNDLEISAMASPTAPAGYSFTGWATTSGGEAVYRSGDIINSVNTDMTLYAVYERNQYETIHLGTNVKNTIKTAHDSYPNADTFIDFCTLSKTLPAGAVQIGSSISVAGDPDVYVYSYYDGTKLNLYIQAQVDSGARVYFNSNSFELFKMIRLTDLQTESNVKLDTSEVTNFQAIFSDSRFTEFDMSWMDFSSATDVSWMFSACSQLTTIYAERDPQFPNVTRGNGMFSGCSNLVGGNGTRQSNDHRDYDYAHIDGGSGDPGYLTLKPSSVETYTLTLDPNGGTSGSVSSLSVSSGTEVTLDATTHPTPADSVSNYFAGWATTSNGELVYGPNGPVIVNDDMTLYAVYRQKITVSYYDENGVFLYSVSGGPGTNTFTVAAGNEISGKIFLGWKDSQSGTAVTHLAGEPIVSDTDFDLYAVYANAVSLTFDPNGGSSGSVTSLTCAEGESVTIPADASPAKSGYNFIGWSDSSGGPVNSDYDVGESVTLDADLTIYAVYEENTQVEVKLRSALNGTSYIASAYWANNNQKNNAHIVICNQNDLPDDARLVVNRSEIPNGDISDAGDGSIHLYAKLLNDTDGTLMVYVCAETTSSVKMILNENSSYLFAGANANAPIFKSITVTDDVTLDSSLVENFAQMFSNASYTELDLSWMTFDNATSVQNMFGWSSSLETIYVSSDPDLSNCPANIALFPGCTSLVGGSGTQFDSSHVRKDYAHIDGGSGDPGYFTLKPSTAATYTLFFDPNGGTSGSTVSLSCTDGGSVTIPASSTPSKTGYSFLGWSDTVNGNINHAYDIGESVTLADDLTVYAIYQRLPDVTLTLNPGTGTSGSVSSFTVAPGTAVVLDETTYPVPADPTSYYFVGWAATSGGELVYDADDSVTVNNNMTLYAVYCHEITVSCYDENGVFLFSISGESGSDTFTVPAGNPISGKIFLGWKDSQSSAAVTHLAGELIVSDTDFDLYAVYANAVSLTFDPNGGSSGSVTSLTCAEGESVMIPANAAPTMPGYDFVGWSDTSGGSANSAYDVGELVTLNANRTLYAVYEESSAVVKLVSGSNFRNNGITWNQYAGGLDIVFCTNTSKPANAVNTNKTVSLSDGIEAKVWEVQSNGSTSGSVTEYICADTSDPVIFEFNQDCSGMFYKITNLRSISFSSDVTPDTSKTTTFNNAFTAHQSGTMLSTIDISWIDFSSVTNTSYMFSGCTPLTTIYISSSPDLTGVTSSSGMFYGCTSLIGGNGTAFDASHTDKSYALIDGENGLPGYFTAIAPASASFALTFNPGEGTAGNISTLIEPSGTIIQLDSNAIAPAPPEGKVFSGWAETANGAVLYDAGDSLALTDNKTLYAKYEPVMVTLKSYYGENISYITQGYFAFANGEYNADLIICNQNDLPSDVSVISNKYTPNGDLSEDNDCSVRLYAKSLNNAEGKILIYLCAETTQPVTIKLNENSSCLFAGNNIIKNITITGDVTLDSSDVKNFSCMFNNTGLQTLDLSWMSFENATNVQDMFRNSSRLKTILVSSTPDLSNCAYHSDMFNGCDALTGGNGTRYDFTHTDKSYACIDSDEHPGYFTSKEPVVTTYTLTFDSGEGAPGAVSSITCTGSETVTIPVESTPTMSGYDFIGWADAPDGEVNTDYDAGNNLTIAENITVYAKYRQIPDYTLTLDPVEGTPGKISSFTVSSGSEIAFDESSSPVPPDGEEFIGWTETVDGTVLYPPDGTLILTENKTLYAVFIDNKGESDNSTVSENDSSDEAEPDSAPVSKDYNFIDGDNGEPTDSSGPDNLTDSVPDILKETGNDAAVPDLTSSGADNNEELPEPVIERLRTSSEVIITEADSAPPQLDTC